MFVYRIQKYIGAYAAALNGMDIVVFTGGIGENNPYIRERVAANLEYLGAHIDREKNDDNATVFSSDDSRVTLMTIPANEEMVIAQQTYEMLTQSVELTYRTWRWEFLNVSAESGCSRGRGAGRVKKRTEVGKNV